jgi:Domain of unknown function (DUF5658)
VLRALVRDRVSDPRSNLAFRLTAAAYIAFSLLDCVTTAEALARGGHERNPLAASLYAHYGVASLFALKAVIVAAIIAVLALLPRRVAVWVAIAFSAVVVSAVVGNLHTIFSFR